MFTEEMKTKEEFKRLWMGFSYHARELSEFMIKHMNDPFFQTDEGKEYGSIASMIAKAHVVGTMKIMTNDIKEKNMRSVKQSEEEKEDSEEEKEEENPSMEDALKELFGIMGDEP